MLYPLLLVKTPTTKMVSENYWKQTESYMVVLPDQTFMAGKLMVDYLINKT